MAVRKQDVETVRTRDLGRRDFGVLSYSRSLAKGREAPEQKALTGLAPLLEERLARDAHGSGDINIGIPFPACVPSRGVGWDGHEAALPRFQRISPDEKDLPSTDVRSREERPEAEALEEAQAYKSIGSLAAVPAHTHAHKKKHA